MSKNAMAGAVTLCGVGLCMIGAALMMQNGQQAHAAAGSMPAAAAAVAATANAQAGPTVVWYGVVHNPRLWTFYANQGTVNSYQYSLVVRAWSDGTIEAMKVCSGESCADSIASGTGWTVVASPTQGYRAAADSNADEKVDAIDLASILSNWGDAPRVPFPPSDCPLNLINP